MKTIFLAASLIMLAGTANASEVTCIGSREMMQDHDIISENLSDEHAKACVARYNTDAFMHIGAYCDSVSCCIFRAHVARRKGNTYFIDRIIGLSPDSTCED